VQAHTAALATLAVGERAWAAWRRGASVSERDVPRVDAIEVEGLRRVAPALLLRHVRQRSGAPLQLDALVADLERAYGDGHYERLDYTVLRGDDGRTVLRLLPVEKAWGPDYLRLGLQLQSTLGQGSRYQLRGALQRTWLNPLGAELLLSAELGDATGAALQFVQPFDPAQRWFAELLLEYRRESSDYFLVEQRIAEYRSARSRAELSLGHNLPRLGQLRAGLWSADATRTLETGIDLFADLPEPSMRGWLAGLEFDRLDRLYFPRRGWALKAEVRADSRRGWRRAQAEGRAAVPLGDWVLAGRASWTASLRGQLPLSEAPRLGGFLNLTGYTSGRLIGDDVAYAHVRTERIIGRLPLGLRGDMRLGLALEGGRVGEPYSLQKRDGVLRGAAVYLGGETPLGSVYLGLGRASGGAVNAYLFLGTP
jgi:NTE family protein